MPSTLELERALELIEAELAERRPSLPAESGGELLPVRQAQGRVLWQSPPSRLDLPPFDKSAMDGYAVLDGDTGQQPPAGFDAAEGPVFRLLETVAAGQIGRCQLEAGTAVKIMTGAQVPSGAGRVAMIEHCLEREGWVQLPNKPGSRNICAQGEDVRRGDPLLQPGRRLRALDLANLLACGVERVRVAPRVRLAILSTGDEIVSSPRHLGPGKIMDANGPMLAGLADSWGLQVVRERIVTDDPEATTQALRSALRAAPIVVLSGGVSAGDYDFVPAALRACDLQIRFQRVAIKPGKPVTFATGPAGLVFGLPGNPVPVYLMFHLFVLRAAAALAGAPWPVRQLRLPLAHELRRRKPGRLEYLPARLDERGQVARIRTHGTAHLMALGQSDGFMAIPPGPPVLRAGERVEFMDLRGP